MSVGNLTNWTEDQEDGIAVHYLGWEKNGVSGSALTARVGFGGKGFVFHCNMVHPDQRIETGDLMIPPYGLGLRVSYTDGYLRADSKIYDRILSSWDERWWINGNGKGTEYQTRGGGVSGSYFESDGRIKQRINATSRLVRTKKTYSDFIIGLAKKTSIPLFDDAMAAFRKNTDGLSAHPDWTAKEQDFFSTLCRRPQRNAYGFLEKFSTLL